MIRRVSVLILSTAVAAGGCTDQNPTGVGKDLLRGGDVHTVEVALDAAAFLDGSETFSGFTRTEDVQFTMVAREFGGSLDAHALVRFSSPAATISYEDTAGTTQTDSTPDYIGGEVVLLVDSVRRTTAPGPVELEARRISEDWDPGSATWELRVDSGAVREAWSEPGGTTDDVLGTAVWEPDTDSVAIPVDSQTVAGWADASEATPEIMVAARTGGVRIFGGADAVQLRLRARPSARPDTVVTTSSTRMGTALVFDPPPDAAPDRLRVGGTPAWRSFLQFRDGLDTLTVPVPADGDTMRVPLGAVTVNYAALQLRPAPVAAAYAPEDSVFLTAHRVLPADDVPLARSAVERGAVGGLNDPIPPDAFAGGEAPSAVELPITAFFRRLAEPADTAADDASSTDLALLSGNRQRFGFAAFSAAGADPAPLRLRLIVTTATEIEIE